MFYSGLSWILHAMYSVQVWSEFIDMLPAPKEISVGSRLGIERLPERGRGNPRS